MPKLRVKPDAPAGLYTVGPIAGPDWKPGDERDLNDLHVFDIDQYGFVPLSEEKARLIADQSGGLVELVPDAPAAKPRKEA